MIKGQILQEREAPSTCSCRLHEKLQESKSLICTGLWPRIYPPMTFSLQLLTGNSHVLGPSTLEPLKQNVGQVRGTILGAR